MQKITAFIIFLVFSGFVFAQNAEDNEECRNLYNQEKFEEAYHCYKADEEKLFSVYMSAYLARFLEYKKDYRQQYKKLLSDQFKTSEKFYYAAYLHPTNSKTFIKTLHKGLKAFPDDTLLLIEKVNYYIEVKDYDSGLPILDKLIELKYDDFDIYITAGNIYNWQEKTQKAIPYFKKALEIDSKSLDANYGLGLIYYNQAADIILLANNAIGTEEQKRLENEANSLLKKALPYLETAFEIEPENKELKSALLTCYLKLGLESKYEALKSR